MNAERAEKTVHRWLINGSTAGTPPRPVRRAMDFLKRKDDARRAAPDEVRQVSLLAYEELHARSEAYRRRAEARARLADYMVDDVLPALLRDTPDYCAIETAAKKLRDARRSGTWGVRPDGSLITAWDDKSGLVRLDPDEAREEAERLADRYAPHILNLADQGFGLHYLVLTAPNVKAGELAAEKKRMYERWVAFNRLEAKGNKAFPEIVGSLVVQEDPIGRNGRWHVHLNVVLITSRKFHAGLYERIRRAWKFNAHMEPIKGDALAIARAFRELVKYSARAVPEKSERPGPAAAPAVTEWAPSMFVEWFNAQRRFRRTRSYGCLYGSQVLRRPKMDMTEITWMGSITLNQFAFRATRPIESIQGDKSTTQKRQNGVRGPP